MKKSILINIMVLLLPAFALGSAELDRRYALESVGFLRSWDNVDGLFEDYFLQAYKEYFSSKSRFRVQNLERGVEIMKRSKLSYRELINDKAVLAQLSRSMRVESVVRTFVFKEGPRYRIQMEWLHAPRMDLIAKHVFYYDQPLKDGSDKLKAEIVVGLDGLVKKVPFVGHVTGRDRDWVTVNVGRNHNLKKGDQLVIETLEEVKKHPLLHSIVDWHFARTGRLVIDDMEDEIAFCKIVEQVEGRKVSRYQKITKLISAKKNFKSQKAQIIYENNEAAEVAKRKKEMPSVGWIAGGLLTGVLSRDFSSGGGGRAGSGFLMGGRAEGQLWLNRNFFAEFEYGFGFHPYGQVDLATNVDTSLDANGTHSRFRFNFGYNYLVTGRFFGPKGWVRLGYHSFSYSLPLSTTERTGPTSFTGTIFVGVGADIPVRDRIRALISIDMGVINGVEAAGLTSTTSSGVTDFTFFLGGIYHLRPRMSIRAGMDVVIQTADFDDSSSLTQRAVSFAPALMYYF